MMGRWDVRVVKEIDSKSIGLVPRRFESCSQRGIFPESTPRPASLPRGPRKHDGPGSCMALGCPSGQGDRLEIDWVHPAQVRILPSTAFACMPRSRALAMRAARPDAASLGGAVG